MKPNTAFFFSIPAWLCSLCVSVSLLLSPLTIGVCKRKSTRLTAVIGGLVAALGCLFSSFASQYHQLFISWGGMLGRFIPTALEASEFNRLFCVVGVGIGMTRDTSTLMVGQYFKRKRELVEMFFVAGSGLGMTLMSLFVNDVTR